MTTAAPPVIAARALAKRFGDVRAVDDASFEVPRGEFFSLLGPSGCGKTTLLRLLAGFETPTSGAVLLEGTDVTRIPPYRRNVNTVFQQYALFPHLTVADNVAFGPRAMGLPRDEVARRVGRMLEVVRLEDLAGRRPHELSGGQQQRVALARALVNMPSALLLDEPLSALDLQLRRTMQLELKRVQREVGIAFVFVTHDQEEALALSDRVAVMRAGRIEQVGTPQEVYRAPRTIFVAGFLGEANLLPAVVEEARDGSATVRVAGELVLVVAAGDAGFRRGAAATLLVRPEQLEVHVARPDGDALAVRVAETVFHGAAVRCVLRTACGDEIVALARPDDAAARLATGDEAWLRLPAAGARLLPPEA
jgi:spermidine/putrescine transport system ATP-binding protein